ncbi:RND family efflux transporter, MFP subunit [Burkholderiales bacterium JOSHI_001]|nr:RND family efflux transporter, MFP subunit [Burkholderiales bacterium JOSHI_001]
MPAFRLRTAALTLALACSFGLAAPWGAQAAELTAVAAQAGSGGTASAFDAVVEAVRQTVVAAQVPGAVVQLGVKVGDRVSAGQVLLRLDARAADQTAAAGDAQVQAARAALEVASKDFERQRQLFQKNYISQAALEQAESQFKATQAQVNAQLAQAGAARTQTGFYVVRAPFAGVVSEVPVSLGDMAMPGRALLTLYDPASLRVTAAVPQSISAGLAAGALPRIEFPGLPAAQQWVQPLRAQLLPTVDPGTHTVQMRADLPAGLAGMAPGMYARLWLPVAAGGSSNATAAVTVPRAAVVRRAELTGLYVLNPKGQPVLRQVRLGRVDGDRVEVLSGLMPGERVVSDPQAAARVQPTAP